MARRTREEALVTRRQILDAAARIFDQRGLEGTTLLDVAEAARVTRGAVYYHFRDKHGLYAAVCAHTPLPLELLPAAMADSGDADPIGRFRKVCLDAMRTLAEPFDKRELIDPAGMLLLRRRLSLEESRAWIEATLRSAVAGGALPADLEIAVAATTVHAMFSGLLGEWLLAADKFDLEARAARLFDALLFMLRGAPSLRVCPPAAPVTSAA
jgi:TetR/AcrR family acrAB operon transcriptional repressor